MCHKFWYVNFSSSFNSSVFSWFLWPIHFPCVCEFVSVSGFRGVFRSLGFCCCPCLFACCRSRFKGLTESLWGFPGYRNQFLLINIRAHLLFIWAWTHYTLRVIQAAALLVKGGFESDGPTERRVGGTQGWLRRPALDSSCLRSHPPEENFVLTIWRAPSCLTVPSSWAVCAKSGIYQDKMLDFWRFHSSSPALVIDLESYWQQTFSKCSRDNCFPSWHLLGNMMNHQNRGTSRSGKQKWGMEEGSSQGYSANQVQGGWSSVFPPRSLSASHTESTRRDRKEVSHRLWHPPALTSRQS